MKINIRLLFVLMVMIAFAACEKGQPDCYQPTSVLVRNGFKLRHILQIDSVVNDTTLLDTTIVTYEDTAFAALAMYSLDKDTNIVVIGRSGASRLGVPFDPATQYIRYVIQFDTASANYDTVTYYYTASNHFISNQCGFTNYYTIDSLHCTLYQIDSFSILKPAVTVLGSDIHVAFYFF